MIKSFVAKDSRPRLLILLGVICISSIGCAAITTSAVLPSFRGGDKKIVEMARHEKFPSPGDVGLGPVKHESR